MLRLRVLSALVLAPPALLAAWFGGFWFTALAAIGGAIMVWEWQRMVTGGFDRPALASAALVAASTLLTLHDLPLALALCVLAAAVAGLRSDKRAWAVAGVLYAGLPSAALAWLRLDPEIGRQTIFWLLLLVWATDIGAYAAGRTIGGPLLLPVVSPKKTWAGLAGGVVSAAVVGYVSGVLLDAPMPALLAAGSGVLAVIAQAGDLAESWVKRRWGVKDSSNIIPGHGGLLDRVDGLLAAAVAVALATWLSGTPVLLWH